MTRTDDQLRQDTKLATICRDVLYLAARGMESVKQMYNTLDVIKGNHEEDGEMRGIRIGWLARPPVDPLSPPPPDLSLVIWIKDLPDGKFQISGNVRYEESIFNIYPKAGEKIAALKTLAGHIPNELAELYKTRRR